MSGIVIDGVKTQIKVDTIRKTVRENIPTTWSHESLNDLVDEICFRLTDMEFENVDFVPEVRYSMACIDYVMEMGDGNPIGIDLLINESDDCIIWDYL